MSLPKPSVPDLLAYFATLKPWERMVYLSALRDRYCTTCGNRLLTDATSKRCPACQGSKGD